MPVRIVYLSHLQDQVIMPPTNLFTPPNDFEQVKSALNGITVFAPRPKKDTSADAKSYICPQCGASLSFDLASSDGIVCSYCGYKQAIQAEHVGHSAKSTEFTLDTVEKAERGWGEMRTMLHCGNCGAELTYSKGVIATTCPYCASNKVNVQVASDDKLRPRFLVPFKVRIDQLPQLASVWLGKGWFHPKELAAYTIVQNFNGIYTPYWVFDSHINAQWQAEVGHEEHYQVYDAAEKRWETRTRIVWEWQDGWLHLPYKDHLEFGISDGHIRHSMLNKVKPFNLADLVVYKPDYLAGLQAQAYDIKLTDAWESAKNSMRESAKNSCIASIHSSYVRNFSMTAEFENETWRYILLPIYLASYRFNEKVYQVMVNGQTGKITGQKPVAWQKVWLAIAACLLPALVIGLIGVITSFIAGIGIPLLGLAGILLVIGVIISFVIYFNARGSEKG